MKVLHLNLSDYSASGGTGIAAHRLHTGLIEAGHQSKILCLIKQLSEAETVYFDRSPITKGIEVESDEQKAKLYAAADLFLFPTRADNAPLVLVESMACGTPMVSFRVCGVPDTVRPGVTGLLAEPEDVMDFRDCIVKLLEDEALHQTLRRKCRETAEREYCMKLYTRRFLDLYQRAIAAHSQPSRPQPQAQFQLEEDL
jgi:glycosyltransferase involved in cell wall biosynthesis